jgi:pyridoxamine 5'-phosphate oxidase
MPPMKDALDLAKKMARLRRDYTFGKLEDRDVSADPFRQFTRWLEDALRKKVLHLDTLALATSTKSGRPSVRMLLLKGFDRRGFVFYTHYDSRKGREIQTNPHAEIVFFWGPLERQVRISGRLAKLPAAESNRYFASRPRESQIGCWASQQSRPVKSRAAIEAACVLMEAKFRGKKIPRPPFWGGYRLVPETFEFWQGRASRLNDRIFYTKRGSRWSRTRLQP